MAVITMWVRLELRRRWRPLLVLTLLVAVAAGTVLTAVAGARRGVSAVDRLLERTLPATVVIGPLAEGVDVGPIRRLPGVEALGAFATYTGYGVEEAPGETVALSVPVDDETMRTVERPVVLAGRASDPDRVDEAVVSPAFVATHGFGVGDVVTVRMFSAEQVGIGVSAVPVVTPPRPEGPAQRVTIVGVVRSLWLADEVGGTGRLFPSPALVQRYRPSFTGALDVPALSALVRLRGGEAAVPAFRAELARMDSGLGASAVDVTDRAEAADRIRDVATFQGAFLLAFALAAFAASAVLVGLAVARYTAATAADLTPLVAVGLTRRYRAACAVAGPVAAGAAGAGLGVALAIGASAWMPFGTAASVEPSPGVDVDVLVLGVGALLTVAMTAGAALAAFATTSARTRSGPATRPSAAARFADSAGLPVPVAVGTRFALEADHGPGATAVRPALLGAVTGVLGIVAAFTLGAGVADAAGHPERFGQTTQLNVGTGYTYSGMVQGPPEQIQAAVRSDPDVVALADTRFATADTDRATVLVHTGPSQDPPLTLTADRLPGPGEAVLAPATARLLGAGIGSEVRLGSAVHTSALRVVGTGLLPQTPYNAYDVGVWVAEPELKLLFGDFFLNRPGLVTLRPGADPATVAARIEREVTESVGFPGDFLFPDLAPVPSRLAEIGELRGLTVVLGAFLALVAVGAVGHMLVASVRRRRRDVAVLRALGLTRRQARGVVATQASVLALVGLVFGVPLGVALGRVLWGVVADLTPLEYRPPVALLTLALVAPVTLLLANALAAWPASRAARLRVGDVLRAD
ncbi:FtsX-like permease family protein [Pseudonocardia saturnea]